MLIFLLSFIGFFCSLVFFTVWVNFTIYCLFYLLFIFLLVFLLLIHIGIDLIALSVLLLYVGGVLVVFLFVLFFLESDKSLEFVRFNMRSSFAGCGNLLFLFVFSSLFFLSLVIIFEDGSLCFLYDKVFMGIEISLIDIPVVLAINGGYVTIEYVFDYTTSWILAFSINVIYSLPFIISIFLLFVVLIGVVKITVEIIDGNLFKVMHGYRYSIGWVDMISVFSMLVQVFDFSWNCSSLLYLSLLGIQLLLVVCMSKYNILYDIIRIIVFLEIIFVSIIFLNIFFSVVHEDITGLIFILLLLSTFTAETVIGISIFSVNNFNKKSEKLFFKGK